MMKRIILLLVMIFFTKSVYANTIANKQGNLSNEPIVKTFIAEMVKKYKFKQTDLDNLFNRVKIRVSAEKSVKTPFEIKPWYIYSKAFITRYHITEGVAFWNKYQAILDRAEKTYGIPASIIVATLGIETSYGKEVGSYRVIDALATLAFGTTTRARYFRSELTQFLLMTREQQLDPLKVMGSYAGAIGQPQFMPSSFRYYAVNFSGNPKIDLSHNIADIIGSIANYYHKNGWSPKQPAAIPASIAGGKYQFSFDRQKQLSVADLIEYGVITDPHILDQRDGPLIDLQTNFGHDYWLTYHNFDVIRRYNPSNMYAMAVYQLSIYITALRERTLQHSP